MSSGFVSENDLAELRRKRQEEWEKVRTANDPLERPEENYDSRSLFERLQEQKQKKDMEYEEAHKLKNMIKGLDDDEIEFLDFVDRTKLAVDRLKEKEEEKELNDFRQRVAILQEKNLESRLTEDIINKKNEKPKSSLSQQQKLLKGAVIVKTIKRKHEDDETDKQKSAKIDNSEQVSETVSSDSVQVVVPGSALKCVGILPGLGSYSESSDEHSSDSEIESGPSKLDLCGRKIEEVESNHEKQK